MTNDTGSYAGISRRDLFMGAGVAVGATAVTAASASAIAAETARLVATSVGDTTEPFYGPHQAGIRTDHQSHGTFAAFTLTDEANRNSLAGVMKVATIEASRLCKGQAGMSDTDPTLAGHPARLTITFGFGHGFFERAGLTSLTPAGFEKLPAFRIDELVPEYSGGDLLIHIGTDDPMTMAHALRHMSRVVASVAVPHYSQVGFVRANGSSPRGETPRNLMGQKDGTENPRDDVAFDSRVWAGSDAGWFEGGTQLVIRRIAMALDTWDLLGPSDKEAAIGRRLESGAPLTGNKEFDAPDFSASLDNGLPVIPDFSHIRRAHSPDEAFKILRRPLNYNDGFKPDGSPDAGLIFAAYTTNIATRFVPLQQRLADMDILNVWTTPIGSSEFVIPPGCLRGGYIGETLLD